MTQVRKNYDNSDRSSLILAQAWEHFIECFWCWMDSLGLKPEISGKTDSEDLLCSDNEQQTNRSKRLSEYTQHTFAAGSH